MELIALAMPLAKRGNNLSAVDLGSMITPVPAGSPTVVDSFPDPAVVGGISAGSVVLVATLAYCAYSGRVTSHSPRRAAKTVGTSAEKTEQLHS